MFMEGPRTKKNMARVPAQTIARGHGLFLFSREAILYIIIETIFYEKNSTTSVSAQSEHDYTGAG